MLARQAKVLTEAQIRTLAHHISTTRYPLRNHVVFMLSVRAGLRAKEIANLTWGMVTDPEGEVRDVISLPDHAAKGASGGIVPMASHVRNALLALRGDVGLQKGAAYIISTQRGHRTSAQAIVNMFACWYRDLGFSGCSSHSGRRTFITRAARNISRYGGSLRDVQALARHSSLSMTQRYIEIDTDAMRKVVDA